MKIEWVEEGVSGLPDYDTNQKPGDALRPSKKLCKHYKRKSLEKEAVRRFRRDGLERDLYKRGYRFDRRINSKMMKK